MTHTRLLLYFASLLAVYFIGLTGIWLLHKWLGLPPVEAYMAVCFVAMMSEIRGLAARIALRRIANGELEDTAASYAQGVLKI